MFFFELLFIVVYHCARNVCVSLTLKSLKENAILDSLPLDINFDKSFEKSDSRENVSQSTPTLFSRTLKENVNFLKSSLTLLQNDKREKNAVNTVRLCEKDYSEFCPDGWNKRMVNGNFMCVAPKSYSGNCSTIIKQSLTEEDKSMFEAKCQVNWPCLDYCERDYSVLCPLNWEESDTKLCHAGASYTDRCARVKDFSHFTVDMKKAWSLSCNLLWPCVKKCNQDYSSPCPEGWSLIQPSNSEGYTCSSPKTYTGPCGPEEAITMFDEQLKKTFAERCQVDFPCLETEMNERDYRILCPKDWLAIVESTSCQAPDTYTGPCERMLYPADYSIKDKKSYEMKCNVRWPDLEKCKPNYDEPCPDSWEFRESKQGLFNEKKSGDCFPLPSYQGPCVGPKRLWDKTPDMKEAFAQVCSASWKCSFKIHSEKQKIKPFLKKIRTGKNGPISPHTGHISA